MHVLLHISLMHLVQITHGVGIEPCRGACTSGVLRLCYARGIAMTLSATEFITYIRTHFGQLRFKELSDCCNY